MNRREALITFGSAGALGGGVLVGGALYGSSSFDIERTDDGTEVRKDGERIDSPHNAVTLVEDDDAILGISMPERATVQRVAVEVLWAIRRDGIWSDVSVELLTEGDVGAPLDPGRATAYSSTWGRSPSEAGGSISSHRRYAYPRGTTAGRVATTLTVEPGTDPEESQVELEARLSARSLSGTRIEVTAPDELIYSPE